MRGRARRGRRPAVGRKWDEVMRPVDVVVPIFEARECAIDCLESVARHARGDVRIVAVDDASRDPALASWLEEFVARESRAVLLRNQTNRGFVVSANRGLRAAGGRDVILLNSDTIVPRRFIEKLAEAAYDRGPGLVTPLTNNGTICSVPRFMEANELPDGLDVDDFARLVDRISTRRRPELVTAVGFCMYVPHDVIASIGFFDEESFPRGYGEENDYSERARAAGFVVRLCDDLFVAHVGRASFGSEGSRREAAHNDVMASKHPGYHERVQRFVRENPLAEIHRELERAIEVWQRRGRLGRALWRIGF
jgi:GT2 family glycosyltransferase